VQHLLEHTFGTFNSFLKIPNGFYNVPIAAATSVPKTKREDFARPLQWGCSASGHNRSLVAGTLR
jgi:hypothetical protein